MALDQLDEVQWRSSVRSKVEVLVKAVGRQCNAADVLLSAGVDEGAGWPGA
jgi:hypothetical protein